MATNIELEPEGLELISFVDEKGVRVVDKDSVLREPVSPQETSYTYINDTGERSVREASNATALAAVSYRGSARSSQRAYEGNDEGGITIRPPQSVSWPIVGSLGIAFLSMVFNVTSVYTRQSNFNEDIVESVEANTAAIRELKANTYTQKEIDLQLQILTKEIEHLEALKGKR